MSGTYRFQVCITRDGVGRHGSTARGGAAEMKKIDRRAKRRQAAKITRDALREHDESVAMDMSEMMAAEFEAFECDSLYDVNDYLDDDFNGDYWAGDYGNQPGDDGWDDPHDGYSWYYDDFHFEHE